MCGRVTVRRRPRPGQTGRSQMRSSSDRVEPSAAPAQTRGIRTQTGGSRTQSGGSPKGHWLVRMTRAVLPCRCKTSCVTGISLSVALLRGV